MRRVLPYLAFLMLAVVSVAHPATITIVNNDAAGEGFNDPTAAAPVGGNPGVTVGAQRLFVFQYAANIWGSILPSNIAVQVNAQFNPLTCTATSGVLGSAGPVSLVRDFAGAPLAGHWYHVALANKLNDTDINGASFEINATFNSSLGGATCLPAGWYLGVDGVEGSQIELLPVVLHELGHGLGFSTPTSGSTGNYSSAFPGIYDHFLFDALTGRHWDDPAETAANRVASAISCGRLAWDGAQVLAHTADFLGPSPLLRVTAPAGIAGDYAVGLPTFGPALSAAGVTGPVALVADNFGNPTNGCETITNNLAGKIAFIDRGTCAFTVKVKNAQDAGAIGVIVADTLTGCPPAGMGGTDATIVIPSVRVTLADGNLIRAQLGAGVTATLLSDPARMAGTDAAGRMLVYTPNPFQSGSSVSHWDTSAEPSLLMEPAITNGLSANIDLTRQLFADIGWFQGLLEVPVAAHPQRLEPGAPNPTSDGMLIAWSLARQESVDLRVFDLLGREVARLAGGPMTEGRHALRWDGTDANGRRVAPGVYRYRLSTPSFSASRSVVVVR
jgi:hypothetical protein